MARVWLCLRIGVKELPQCVQMRGEARGSDGGIRLLRRDKDYSKQNAGITRHPQSSKVLDIRDGLPRVNEREAGALE